MPIRYFSNCNSESMKSKNTKREGSSHSVRQQEGRRRQVFIFKLLFFVVIILIQLRYPELTTDYGVSSHIIEAVLFYVTAHMIISFTRLFLVYLYINNRVKEMIMNLRITLYWALVRLLIFSHL